MFKFNLFKKKQNFKSLLPAISPYFHNVKDQNIILENKSFIDKYNRHSNLIEYFVLEIEKYYTDDEIRYIIQKYIIGLDDNRLVELINIYFSKSETDKRTKQFFKYYDEKYNMVDVSEEDVNEINKLDESFEKLKGNTRKFNNIDLSDLYNDLDLSTKRYLVSLLKKDSIYKGFKRIFEYKYRIHFKSLLKIMINKSIDPSILNDTFVNAISNQLRVSEEVASNLHRELVMTLMTNENIEIARYVKVLIKNNKVDILINMISRNLLSDKVFNDNFDIASNKELTDKDIIEAFEKVRYKRNINN